MKKTALPIAAILLAGIPQPDAQAADVRLVGKYSYTIGATRNAAPNGYVLTSGRSSYILAKFVRQGAFQGGTLENRGTTASNYMSLEFHRTAFAGATSGQSLNMLGVPGLNGGARYTNVAHSSYFKSPNKDGFGAVVLYELDPIPPSGIPSWTRRFTKTLPFARF